MRSFDKILPVRTLIIAAGTVLACMGVVTANPQNTYAVTNANMCMNDNVAEDNVVVFVKILDSDNNLVRFSDNFRFRVESYSARSGSPSATYNSFKQNAIIGWNDGAARAYGKGGVELHAKLGGDGQPEANKGNLCDPNGGDTANRKLAYAFRSGDGTKKVFSGPGQPDGVFANPGKDHDPGYNNNGSLSLSCLTLPETAYRFSLTDVENGSLGGSITRGTITQESPTPNATGEGSAVNGAQIRVVFEYKLAAPPPPPPPTTQWDVVPLLDQASGFASVGRYPVIYRYYGYAHLGTVSRNVRLSALYTWGDPAGNWTHAASTIFSPNTWGAGQYRDVAGGLSPGGQLIYWGNYGEHGSRLCGLGTVTPRGGAQADSYMKYGAASTNAWQLGPGGGADSLYDFGGGNESIETTHKLCTTIVEEWESSPMVKLRVNGAEVGTEITNVGPGHLQTVERAVSPGDTVDWMRGINQFGPGSVAGGIPIYGAHGGNFNNSDPGSPTSIDSPGAYWLSGWEGNRAITQNDVSDSTRICSYQVADPWKGQLEGSNYVIYRPGNGNMSVFRRADACATVPYNYRIIPSVNIRDTEAEAETTVGTASVSVGFQSLIPGLNPTKTRATEWQLNTFVLAPGANPSGQGDSTSAPISHYSYKAGSWRNVSSGSGKVFVPSTDDTLANAEAQIGAEPVGSKFCFVLSVKPSRSDNAALWGHSMPSCAVIGIKPKLQVRGHDLKVGQKINTGVSRLTNRTYGSFGEYGMLSGLLNKGMGSGSGLLGGSVTAAQENWSSLTLANNTGPSGTPSFGSFGTMTPFVTNDNGATVINGNTTLPAATGVFASPWGAGAQQILKINGTLTITDDLLYGDGPYTSINQIPRIVIVADDIVIEADVKRIDVWLAANRIATCSDARDGTDHFVAADRVRLAVDMCSESLRFNGPVAVNQLFPYRTTNAGNDTNIAAEIFNLRADAFLSSFAGGGLDVPIASTDLVTDLPPRF